MQDINENLVGPAGPTPPPSGPPHINPLTGKPADMARPAVPPKPLDEKPSDLTKPATPTPQAIPKKPDWTPINVKTGIFKNKELFSQPRRSFVYKEQKDLKDVLRGGKNFGVRKALAEELANKRGRGLTRKEIKDSIKAVKQKFGLSDVKARQLRHKFGSYK